MDFNIKSLFGRHPENRRAYLELFALNKGIDLKLVDHFLIFDEKAQRLFWENQICGLNLKHKPDAPSLFFYHKGKGYRFPAKIFPEYDSYGIDFWACPWPWGFNFGSGLLISSKG